MSHLRRKRCRGIRFFFFGYNYVDAEFLGPISSSSCVRRRGLSPSTGELQIPFCLRFFFFPFRVCRRTASRVLRRSWKRSQQRRTYPWQGPHFWDWNSFNTRVKETQLILSFALGFIFAMLAFNFLIFFQGEKGWLAPLFVAIGLAFYALNATGMDYLLGTNRWISYESFFPSQVLTILGSLIVSHYLLNLKKTSP